jgi:zinc protease
MLRRGAGKFDAFSVEKQLDRIGAAFGESAGISVVSLHMTVIRRSLDQAIDMLAMLAGEPAFDAIELAKLIRQQQGEIVEMRDNDRALASRAFRRSVFAGHPLGRRASGQIATLESITRDDVLAHYKKVFSKNNLVMAFAGDISEAEAQQASSKLESVLSNEAPVGNKLRAPSVIEGRRLVFVDKPERTQTQVLIGGLGTEPHDADHTALTVANTVLGGTFTSRLMREVRSKRGWSYGAYASLPIETCRESFNMWTHPGANDAPACIALELSLLEDFCKNGITAEELHFAKRFLCRSHAFEIDTALKRVQQKLSVSLYDLPVDYHSGYLERVSAMTLDEANQAVRSRISTENLIVAMTGTHEGLGQKVAEAIPGLAETTVVPHDLE